MTDEKTFNKWFNVFLVVGMTVCLTIACIHNLTENSGGTGLTSQPWFIILTSVGALMGVISTILAANANILTFVFGLIDVIIFSFTLFDQRIYMLLALHVGYFIPMEFIGFYQWKKRGGSASDSTLRTRRLKGVQWLWTALLFAGVFGVVMLLRWSLDSGALATLTGWDWLLSAAQEVNFKDMALDCTMTTANIVALVLMALAFTDQWYLWILVNISSIIAFSSKLSAGGPESSYTIAQLLKYIFYLLNSINALRIWLKLSRQSGQAQEPADAV